MVYQFKNQCCPVCGKSVSPYSYMLDEEGNKVHISCKEDMRDS